MSHGSEYRKIVGKGHIFFRLLPEISATFVELLVMWFIEAMRL